MFILGIYASPREKGNSDILLDFALKGARSTGAEVRSLYVRDLEISGCIECGECEKKKRCIINDDMQKIYPVLIEASVVILSSPVFFGGFPSKMKAFIDRCQALWITKRGKTPKGKGFLIAVGAKKKKENFDALEFTARHFFDAISKQYERGLFLKGVEKKADILSHHDALSEAFELGKSAAEFILSVHFPESQKTK